MSGGGGGGSAPAPDPNIGIAALKNAQLGEKWLATANEQFGIANQRQAVLDALTSEVTRDQLGASRTAQQWAREDRDRDMSVFRPMQDEFIDTAKNWDSPERQAQVAAEARADVAEAAAIQQQQRAREMAAMGVDPTSGRYAGIERAADLATGLQMAGAQNTARNTVRNQALGLKADAINMGKGLGINPGASLGLGVSAGGQALAGQAAANQAANSNVGILQNGYGQAMQGYTNQANILQNQYNSQLGAWTAQQQAASQESAGLFGGLGSMVGMMGASMFMSDEDAKEDKKPSSGNLAKVRGLRIDDWNYKAGSGEDPAPRHTGTYAQDFQRETGRGNGKTIPVVDAIGVTMGAIQELADDVDGLKRAVSRGIRQGA